MIITYAADGIPSTDHYIIHHKRNMDAAWGRRAVRVESVH